MVRRAAASHPARRGRASAALARRPAVWLLLALLLLMLFPFSWLGQRWPLLYPPLRQQPWRYALWALAVSCAQEGLQLL